MNWTQYQRWKGFSLRMTRRGYPNITEARQKRLERECSGWFEYIIPSFCEPGWKAYEDWNGENGHYLCDDVSQYFEHHFHWQWREQEYGGRFYNQIVSCIRAGFDMAVEPSAGVIGFTVGDLRRMYPRGIPSWLMNEFTDGFKTASDTEHIWL